MTDEEKMIVEALRCCGDADHDFGCNDCPLPEDGEECRKLVPLAAYMIERMASEVEPYPIAVTRSRFPHMKHLGNVTEIHGAEITPVDIITFGSPCQDLSVAGKRAGIQDGARSNLFFEAIRIIKEMRSATNGKYPRYAVWENVPGAFSSNHGEDFRSVLQSFIGIGQAEADKDKPESQFILLGKPEKWSNAGEIVGDGYSVAWRVLDAQYWGVAQRRRRIYLVADFATERAGEVLFERDGLQRGFAESGATRKDVAADAAGSAGGSGGDCLSFSTYAGFGMDLIVGEKSPTLRANGRMSCPSVCFHLQQDPIPNGVICPCIGGQAQATVGVVYPTVASALCARYDSSPYVDRGQTFVVFAQNQRDEVRDLGDKSGSLAANHGMKQQTYVAAFMGGQGAKAGGIGYHEELSPTLKSVASGGNTVPDVVYDARGNGDGYVAPTLTGDHQRSISDYTAVCVGNGQLNQISMADRCNALDCMHDKQTVLTTGKLPRKYIIRRLTPTECARLQGFPDCWGCLDELTSMTDDDAVFWESVRKTKAQIDGKPYKRTSREKLIAWYNKLHSDSSEYKMWGNGIALPCARFVLSGIARESGVGDGIC